MLLSCISRKTIVDYLLAPICARLQWVVRPTKKFANDSCARFGGVFGALRGHPSSFFEPTWVVLEARAPHFRSSRAKRPKVTKHWQELRFWHFGACVRHTEIDRKSSQCAPALRRTSRTTNLDPKSAIVAPKMPNLPPKMAFVAPKMALWALLVASRTCPEASPERPWAPRGHQNRFLTAILVAWDALGLVFGVRFGQFWRPAMLLTGRFVTPTLQPCTRPYTSAAPK